MGTILIVEDDPNKASQIASCVEECGGQSVVETVRSYQRGVTRAMELEPTVVLLDMTLPTYDVDGGESGGRVRPFGGQELLRYLQRRSLRTRVILVTQFESFGEGQDAKSLHTLERELNSEFPELYVGSVFYEPAALSWRSRLHELLSDLLEEGA